jgi:hypothetical protein
LLFMTLSHGAAAPSLLRGLLEDTGAGYDEATLALIEKSAERGAVAAQLMLARSPWTGRAIDSDVIRAYLWLRVALDHLTRTKDIVEKSINPMQLAEAERRVRERLNKSRIESSHSARTFSSDYERGIVA